MNRKTRVTAISLILAMIIGLGGCLAANPPAPAVPAPVPPQAPAAPAPAPPETMLPESPPYWAQSIRGCTTLKPFGTEQWSSTYPGKNANVARTESFKFPSILPDRYKEELVVLFIVYADKGYYCSYAEREPGGMYYELTSSGQGLYEFSPMKFLYKDELTLEKGQPMYATAIVGKLRARGTFTDFRLEFANFDYREHCICWEIYYWQE